MWYTIRCLRNTVDSLDVCLVFAVLVHHEVVRKVFIINQWTLSSSQRSLAFHSAESIYILLDAVQYINIIAYFLLFRQSTVYLGSSWWLILACIITRNITYGVYFIAVLKVFLLLNKINGYLLILLIIYGFILSCIRIPLNLLCSLRYFKIRLIKSLLLSSRIETNSSSLVVVLLSYDVILEVFISNLWFNGLRSVIYCLLGRQIKMFIEEIIVLHFEFSILLFCGFVLVALKHFQVYLFLCILV